MKDSLKQLGLVKGDDTRIAKAAGVSRRTVANVLHSSGVGVTTRMMERVTSAVLRVREARARDAQQQANHRAAILASLLPPPPTPA